MSGGPRKPDAVPGLGRRATGADRRPQLRQLPSAAAASGHRIDRPDAAGLPGRNCPRLGVPCRHRRGPRLRRADQLWPDASARHAGLSPFRRLTAGRSGRSRPSQADHHRPVHGRGGPVHGPRRRAHVGRLLPARRLDSLRRLPAFRGVDLADGPDRGSGHFEAAGRAPDDRGHDRGRVAVQRRSGRRDVHGLAGGRAAEAGRRRGRWRCCSCGRRSAGPRSG